MEPLETLYEAASGDDLWLPPELAAIYGGLRIPLDSVHPYVIANFVSSLDGVAALNVPGKLTGGGEIAGPDPHDHLVMGLLRALADVIVVGAGTVRAAPGHIWTAEHIYPPLAEAYRQLRARLGKERVPLNVMVTDSGELDLNRLTSGGFRTHAVPVLIVTTSRGARRLRERAPGSKVQVVALDTEETLSAKAILDALGRVGPASVILTEGGPQLLGGFFAERCLNELFLTLSPQVAGRDRSRERPGFVAGKLFAPEHPVWGTLIGAKRSGSHLFLRYSFESARC